MANNRMYLRCKGCGACLMLAKHWAGPWVSWDTNLKRLDNYFEWHFGCASYSTEHGPEDFELIFEMDDDFEDKYRNWLDDLPECVRDEIEKECC